MDQSFKLFSLLMNRLESLDVCNIPIGTLNEQVNLILSKVELTSTHLIPSLVHFITESPLQIVNSLMRIILERHNLLWLAKSKIGLSLLTLFLSRAEIIKQSGVMEDDHPDLMLWTEIYSFLFISLQTHFASLFPKTESADEIYVWQFLAAMAVSATSPDHQRCLVMEVR